MKTDGYIQVFLRSKMSKGLSPESIRWYREILSYFRTMHPTLPTKPEAIEDFIASCKGSDERRHGYYRTLRCFYRFLERRYRIANPVRMIDPPRRRRKEPRTLNREEIYILLSYPHSPLIKASLAFLADTGCRLGELYNLKPQDFKSSPWGFIVSVNGKTGRRNVPVSYEVAKEIIPHLPFKFKKHWLGEMLSRAFKEAGIPGTAHTLRHTFATLWEGDEFALNMILGHSHMETTAIYRHLRIDFLASQHNRFSPVVSGVCQPVML